MPDDLLPCRRPTWDGAPVSLLVPEKVISRTKNVSSAVIMSLKVNMMRVLLGGGSSSGSSDLLT